MDENLNHASTSILIGCGVISILLCIARFTALKGSDAYSTEVFGFLFFGVGYLLLGLSRKNTHYADRQKLFSSLAMIALLLGTALVSFYTYNSLK